MTSLRVVTTTLDYGVLFVDKQSHENPQIEQMVYRLYGLAEEK